MMRLNRLDEEGNVLICALCTILIISLIGANVLHNCTTRFNVSSSQVRSWKESLLAAETGGDIAYAEVRKTITAGIPTGFPDAIPDGTVNDPLHAFHGWRKIGSKYSSPETTFGANGLVTGTVVDKFYNDPITGNKWYRARSKGTSPVKGVA